MCQQCIRRLRENPMYDYFLVFKFFGIIAIIAQAISFQFVNAYLPLKIGWILLAFRGYLSNSPQHIGREITGFYVLGAIITIVLGYAVEVFNPNIWNTTLDNLVSITCVFFIIIAMTLKKCYLAEIEQNPLSTGVNAMLILSIGFAITAFCFFLLGLSLHISKYVKTIYTADITGVIYAIFINWVTNAIIYQVIVRLFDYRVEHIA